MKFAVAGPTYPFRGGIARHTTLLCRHLARRHPVHLVSFRPRVLSRLFRQLDRRDPSRAPLRPEAEGLRCDYLLDPLNPMTWRQAARNIWAQPPDALVLPWGPSLWAPAWTYLAIYARRCGTRVIFICHDVIPHDRLPGKSALARLALRRADAFIIQTESQAHVLAQLLGRLPTAIRRLSHPRYDEWPAALPPRGQAREMLGLSQTEPVLLFFGLVRSYKGLADLMIALARVRAELPARLVVAGEFWEDIAVYRRLARNLGLDDAVVFHDFYVPDEEVPPLFAAADVVVLPYRRASQSGVVALAHGLGRPVIATRVGGLPEMIADGQIGLLVPPADPDALAEAILRFYREGLGPAFETALIDATLQSSDGSGSWQSLVEAIEGLV